MTPAFLVANSFLKRSFEENREISPMKLQKLTYFVYKKYLQDTGYALFEEDFEVWQFGPVLPSIYREFSHYGARPITDYAYAPFDDQHRVLLVADKSREFYKALDFVWSKYGCYSATKLSELTHEDETAWKKALDRKEKHLSDDDIEAEEWLQ